MKRGVFRISMHMLLMFVFAAALAAGCAREPAPTPTPVPAPEEQVATEEIDTGVEELGTGEGAIDESMVGETGMEDTAAMTDAVPALERIHFAFDRYDLSPEAQAILVNNAEYLKANPDTEVLIAGHCDERGSDEYNLALGERRALAAKAYLVDLGIDAARINVTSYGEFRPIDASHNETAYAMNRRAEFTAAP